LHPIPRLKGKDAKARAKTVGFPIPAKFSACGGCQWLGGQDGKYQSKGLLLQMLCREKPPFYWLFFRESCNNNAPA